jgi:hypothetical protein
MLWAGHVYMFVYKRERYAYTFLVGKAEGKSFLTGCKHKKQDNIKIDLRNRVSWCGLDSSGSG